MPRRAALAQATASRESPAGRGTPCTAGDRRLARRVRGPRCSQTRVWRASSRRKAGGTAGYIIYIYIYIYISLTRFALRASRFALRASRFALRALALRAARFALRATRSCASRAPERILSWRITCARRDALRASRRSCSVRSVYKVGRFRAQSQHLSLVANSVTKTTLLNVSSEAPTL